MRVSDATPGDTNPGVLFLHGQPGGAADWRLVVGELESGFGSNAQVLAADRPGYGDNPEPAGGFGANASAAIAAMDAAGISSAVVVAHSWAGGIAIYMAKHFPSRVAGLVLVSSVGPGAVDWTDRLLLKPVIGRAAAFASVGLGGVAIQPRLQRIFHLLTGPGEGSARAMITGNGNRRLVDTFLTEQRALVDELPSLLPLLESISVPVTIICAANDHVVPARVGRALASAIPGSTLVTAPRAGHFVLHRSPSVVADAIRALL